MACDAVFGGGERFETAGERVEAVKGEDFDEESERRVLSETSSWFGERVCGLGDEKQENDDGHAEEEKNEKTYVLLVLGKSHHRHAWIHRFLV